MNQLTCPTACAPSASPETRATVQPPYTWTPAATQGVLRVWIPGAVKESVELKFDDGALHLRAPRADAVPTEWRVLRREQVAADYALQLSGFTDVDAERIEARLENGVLELVLPKQTSAAPRLIPLKG